MARDCYDDCIASLDDQLGRLLDDLRGQGLLDNTLVIITADHGESFGDHRRLRPRHRPLPRPDRRPAGDPLPGRTRGPRRSHPVSLRDLPATVVDQLGLSAGSPFPGHSLAAFWSSAPGQALREITPALSELAHAERVPASASEAT